MKDSLKAQIQRAKEKREKIAEFRKDKDISKGKENRKLLDEAIKKIDNKIQVMKIIIKEMEEKDNE